MPANLLLFFPIRRLRMRFVGFHLLLVATLLNLLGLQFLSKGSNVPKWAFIARLACSRRLATKDGLRSWGMGTVSASCVFCQQSDESHDHLFFDCTVSRLVWADILRQNLIQRNPGDWDLEIDWAWNHAFQREEL